MAMAIYPAQHFMPQCLFNGGCIGLAKISSSRATSMKAGFESEQYIHFEASSDCFMEVSEKFM